MLGRDLDQLCALKLRVLLKAQASPQIDWDCYKLCHFTQRLRRCRYFQLIGQGILVAFLDLLGETLGWMCFLPRIVVV